MSIKKMTLAGFLLTILLVVTVLIKIPAVNNMGYLNLSDALIILYITLMPDFDFLAVGGLGAALADIILGYGIYWPFTLIIKFLEALIVYVYLKKAKTKNNFSYAIVVALALSIMVVGYGLTDAFLFQQWSYFYVSILFNLNQAVVAFLVILITKPALEKAFSQFSGKKE